MGKSLNVATSYYSDIECGRRTVSMKFYQRVNQIYPDNIDKSVMINQRNTVSEKLDYFKNKLTNDDTISDHDYRVMIKTIDKIEALLKD